MQSLTQPELLLKPFAENGDKNEIPVQNQTISQPQLADLTNGFPEITSKDPSDGGLPPERKDFNALGYLTTSYDYFYQAGGTFTFSQAISDAIGGYPEGSRLWYTDSGGLSCILRSTIANNTNNFLEDESVIGDSGSGAPWEVENFRGIVNEQSKPLFDFKWADHLLYDISWLRADTFSWQSGRVYDSAYKHLVQDVEDSKTKYFAWQDDNDNVIYTTNEEPSSGDITYTISGGTASVDGTVLSYDSDNLCIVDADSITSYRYDDGDTSLLNPKTETFGGYTITYYEAPDGHKITTDENTVLNIYNAVGSAWYYVLDTTNQRFKLPRENPAREKLIQVVRAKGTDVSLGFTDGTNTYSPAFASHQDGSMDYGSLGSSVGTTTSTYRNVKKTIGIVKDSTKSGIVSDMTESTSVYKGKKYLYFYVGDFNKTAIEQTAGLNAELFNGKVDLNAQNLSDAGKSLIAGFGMPSNSYDDLTLGASGTNYTAPANGWFYVKKFAGATGKYISIMNTTSALATEAQPTATGNAANIFLPVKKGDIVEISYNVTGNTDYFRFIYAVGSESEES